MSVRCLNEKRWGFFFTSLSTRAVHFEVISSEKTPLVVRWALNNFSLGEAFHPSTCSATGWTLLPVKKKCWTTSSIGISKFRLKFCLISVSSWNSFYRVRHTREVFGKDWQKYRIRFPCYYWKQKTDRWNSVDYILSSWTKIKRSFTSSSKCRCNWLGFLNSKRLPAKNSRLKFTNEGDDQFWPEKTLCAYLRTLTPSGVNGWESTSRFSSADSYLETGDLVWTIQATSPRGYYPLSSEVKLNYLSDAIVRSTEVKTMSGNLIRPIVKLALFLPPADTA